MDWRFVLFIHLYFLPIFHVYSCFFFFEYFRQKEKKEIGLIQKRKPTAYIVRQWKKVMQIVFGGNSNMVLRTHKTPGF
jgi:hypothetical protein